MNNINDKKSLNIITLIMMISFASVNAVLFTPALPQISEYFGVSDNAAQITLTIFLIGYSLGQLIYGPIANRFGRKNALFIGIAIQIIAAILCGLSSPTHSFTLLVVSRLLLALGSCVGMKMTFTMVGESYNQVKGAEILSYAMLAFAISPSIGTTIGGYLAENFGFASCFYFLAFYGVVVAFFVMQLPETLINKDKNALKFKTIVTKYKKELQLKLVGYALIMGSATALVYLWAALSPYLAINVLHASEKQYGLWNLIPSIGMLIGFTLSAKLVRIFNPLKNIFLGIIIAIIGVGLMFALFLAGQITLSSLFLPMIIVYIGEAIILNNSSSSATYAASDKSNASAILNFINMGVATISVVSATSFTNTTIFFTPIVFFIILLIITILTVFVYLQNKNTPFL